MQLYKLLGIRLRELVLYKEHSVTMIHVFLKLRTQDINACFTIYLFLSTLSLTKTTMSSQRLSCGLYHERIFIQQCDDR